MSNNILITDGEDITGKALIEAFSGKNNTISLFCEKLPELKTEIEEPDLQLIKSDFTDTKAIRTKLRDLRPDLILHNKFVSDLTDTRHLGININFTEQLAVYAMENSAKLIYIIPLSRESFNTRTGQFNKADGAHSPINSVNDYSGLRADKIILKYVLYGLNGIIVRYLPLYGNYNQNVIYQLTELAGREKLRLPRKKIKLQLCYLEDLVSVVKKVVTDEQIRSGSELIAADLEPVLVSRLADMIHKWFFNSDFPESRYKSDGCFRIYRTLTKLSFGNRIFFDLLEDPPRLPENIDMQISLIRKSDTMNTVRQLLPNISRKLGVLK